jgi:tryptophan-rich hypothetical protein
MNRVHPKKLFNSKWTAVQPLNKERHFLVTEVELDEDEQVVVSCVLEPVMTKRSRRIGWRELTDSDVWLQGWK